VNIPFRTGLVAVVGRPNVGKSTLVNALVGAKVSIVSSKPQTTRHRILGVRTEADAQFIFADTPGFQTQYKNALNQAMNRAVTQALAEVDLVLWLVEAMKFTAADARILPLLPRDKPVILVVNKVDTVADKTALLPYLQSVSGRFGFAEIVPLSAESEKDAQRLPPILKPYLPEGEAWFTEDDITDRSSRFLAAEIVREKVFRQLGDELPYATSVVIEKYETGKRGIFSGALGYINPSGDFDFNVVIRSIMYNEASGYLSYQVGSGITHYSNAAAEWDECMMKAEAIKKVFQEKLSGACR